MTTKNKIQHSGELNYISHKSIEQIIHELHALPHDDVEVQVVPLSKNKVIFQLIHTDHNRKTAKIYGRLQRWAGNMTYVHCDGHIFTGKGCRTNIFRFIATTMIIASIFVLAVGGGTLQVAMTAYLVIFIGFVLLYLFPDYRETVSSKPEQKDREQLLQYLTEIIADNRATQAHHAIGTELDADAAQPLSEEEIATLLQQKVIRA